MHIKKNVINKIKPIWEIAAKIGLRKKDLESCGKYVAKISFAASEKSKDKDKGKLILLTSTTLTQNIRNNHSFMCERLMQALSLLRKRTILCMPSFTIEDLLLNTSYPGIFPIEDVLTKLTDINNISYCHNFISSFLNNELIFNNSSNLNPYNIVWNRASNVRDETLRRIVTGVGNRRVNRLVKEESFEFVLNSELTSIVSLSLNVDELKNRVGRIILGSSKNGYSITVKDMKIEDLVTSLLKGALKPNLIQNKYGDPVFLYTSSSGSTLPSGNLLTAKTALGLAEYVILKLDGGVSSGIEKFLNITGRGSGIKPDMLIITTFVNELNSYGGCTGEKIYEKNLPSLEKGVQVLLKDIEIVKKFGIPVLVNVSDYREVTRDEMKIIDKYCSDLGVKVLFSQYKSYNVKSGLEFVKSVLETIRIQKSYYKPLYDLNLGIKEKIKIISKEVYGKSKISYNNSAEKEIEYFEKSGYGKLPVSIARVPYFQNGQENSNLSIRGLLLYAGAGVIVALTEDIEFMPSFTEKYDLERVKNVI